MLQSPNNQDRSGQLIADLTKNPSPDQYAELADLLSQGQAAAEDGIGNLDEVIASIEAKTVMKVDRSYFVTLYGWTTTEEQARIWAITLPDPVTDLSRQEISSLLSAANENLTSYNHDRFLWFFRESLGNAFSTSLIFHPYAEWDVGGLADEIVRRRALLNDGGQEALDAYEFKIAKAILKDENAKPWAEQWAEGTIKQRISSSAQ